MQPDRPYFVPRRLTATIVLAAAIVFASDARAADVVGAVASTAGAAVGVVNGALSGGGGGNGGAGAGGGAVARGGGATAPSLAGFLGVGGGGQGGGASSGGAGFRGDDDIGFSDDDLMIRASSEGNVDYNVMLTKKIFSW